MIFRRNKTAQPSAGKTTVLRGRDSTASGDNPLARRFHPEDEPDTIDLQQPEGFTDEPGTAELDANSAVESEAAGRLEIISMVPETGKFYVLPGTDENVTYLGNEPVTSPTELRPGDRIRAGKFELCLLS
jgi:hypothetical protein